MRWLELRGKRSVERCVRPAPRRRAAQIASTGRRTVGVYFVSVDPSGRRSPAATSTRADPSLALGVASLSSPPGRAAGADVVSVTVDRRLSRAPDTAAVVDDAARVYPACPDGSSCLSISPRSARVRSSAYSVPPVTPEPAASSRALTPGRSPITPSTAARLAPRAARPRADADRPPAAAARPRRFAPGLPPAPAGPATGARFAVPRTSAASAPVAARAGVAAGAAAPADAR